MNEPTAQGAESAAAEIGTDGFTADERAQFEQMRTEAPAPEPPAEGKDAPAKVASVDQPELPIAAEDDEDEELPQGTQPDQQGEKPPPRRVNYNKFARVENERNALRAERDQLKEMFSRSDERLKLLNEALTGGQKRQQEANEDQDPEPDKEKDVFEWMNWAGRQMANMSQMISEGQQQSIERDDEKSRVDAYIEDARVFATQEQNFVPAYNFLMANRTFELAQYYFGKDLSEKGVTLTTQELAQIKNEIASEERELVHQAQNANKSPAQRVFALAKARGFRPPAPAEPAAAQPNGGAMGQLSVAAEIERIKQGQHAGTSLSMAAGSPGNTLTAEKIANMSQDEFGRLYESLTPDQQRKMMGG